VEVGLWVTARNATGLGEFAGFTWSLWNDTGSFTAEGPGESLQNTNVKQHNLPPCGAPLSSNCAHLKCSREPGRKGAGRSMSRELSPFIRGILTIYSGQVWLRHWGIKHPCSHRVPSFHRIQARTVLRAPTQSTNSHFRGSLIKVGVLASTRLESAN
jgi:hypothetical protein